MAYISPIKSGFDPFKTFSGFTPAAGSPTVRIPQYSSPAGPSKPYIPPQASPSGVQSSTPAVSSSPPGPVSNFFGGLVNRATAYNPVSNPFGNGAPASSPDSSIVPTANAQTTDSQSTPLARPSAQPGDPWYGVRQSDVDSNPALSPFLNGLAKQGAPSNGSPIQGDLTGGLSGSSTGTPVTGFGVSVPNQTNSNVVGAGNSYADALNSRNQIMQAWMDSQNKYAQDYQNITGQEIKGQFAGDTTDYGTGMANLIRMEGTPVLNADQMRAQNFSNMAGANAQTLSALSPMQVSPGSSMVSPLGGPPIFQGQGAAPSTIMGTAQSLAQLAIQNGSAQYNPDGSINMQPYIQQAQQFYGGGMGGGAMGGVPNNSQGQNNNSNGGYGQNGYGNIDLIPSGLQYSVKSDSIGDQSIRYMNGGQISPALLPSANKSGGLAGIPVLDTDGVRALNSAQQILGIVDAAKALSIRNLKSGVEGRVSDSLVNWANNYLQFNPDLSNFDQLRDAASRATTALAGGSGSGFRMNTGIIEAAVNNLPRASDNLETALTRSDALATQIINGLKPVFPNVANGRYGNLLQSQYAGSQGGQIDWANLQ